MNNRFKSYSVWLQNKTLSESEASEPQEASLDAEVQTSTSTISNDVDTIIHSLEVLSTELSEDIDSQIESILNEEFEDVEMINENFLEKLKEQIASMKAYATLTSTYPKFKKDEARQKVAKIQKLGQYDLDSEDAQEKLKEATKEKFEKTIEDTKEKFASDPAKKKVAVQKLRDARDEALKAGKESSIAKKIAAGKAKLTAKLDQEIRKSATDITNLVSKNTIKSELMKAQWDKQKIEIDDKFALALIDQELEAQFEFAEDNPEAQKRIEARSKKAKAQIAKDTARKAADADTDIKELSDEYDRISKEGDEKQKAANIKIKAFFDNGRKYIQQLGATLGSGDESEIEAAAKKTLIDSRKAYNEAKNAITAGTFTVADSKLSKDEAEEQFETFKKMIDDQVTDYDDKVKGFEKEQPEETEEEVLTDDQTQKIQGEETQMAERQSQLDAELAKPEEEQNQDKIEGLKAGIAKNKEDIAAIKSNQGESVVISDLGDNLSEATVVMDAVDPEDKKFLKFLKKHNIEITDSVEGVNGFPEITMQGKREDLEKVLADDKLGWDDADLAEYIEESEEVAEEESEEVRHVEVQIEDVVEESCESCNCNPCECAKESLVNRATQAGLTELAKDINSKESWQVAEGTTLRNNYISLIKKAESDKVLNESKYINDSVKDAFRRLM